MWKIAFGNGKNVLFVLCNFLLISLFFWNDKVVIVDKQVLLLCVKGRIV